MRERERERENEREREGYFIFCPSGRNTVYHESFQSQKANQQQEEIKKNISDLTFSKQKIFRL